MAELQYRVLTNPAGITFNPVSIAGTIKSIFSADSLPGEALLRSGELWCHPDFHSCFSNTNRDIVRDSTQRALAEARSYFESVTWVIITIGTAYVYRHKELDRVVNNCHKLPAHQFDRQLLSSASIYDHINEAIETVKLHCSQKINCILTLSPVRHIRDGIESNQRSKARCLEAIHLLCDAREDCYYFPSYEIMLDDLRDYRFYKTDLIHPSMQALDYIFEKFEHACLKTEEQEVRDAVSGINRSIAHKSRFPDGAEHRRFRSSLQTKASQLELRYPFLKFDI